MNLIAPTLIICDAQQFIGTQSPRRGMSVGCLFAGKRTRCQHGEGMVFFLGVAVNMRDLRRKCLHPQMQEVDGRNLPYAMHMHMSITGQRRTQFSYFLLSH